MKKSCGFTIIEMLVTVVLISILATLSIPFATHAALRSKEQDLKRALTEIRAALDRYRQASAEGKLQKLEGESGYPQSLHELTSGVPDVSDPQKRRIYFLRRLPRDPFAPKYLSAERTWGLRSYDSTAEEPAPGDDVFDIYSLSRGVGLNGVPYRQW